jgi:hypothetical protein
MMRVYIDESGHEGNAWVVLAGFVGTEENWKAFVPKWKEALGPQRKRLHMNRLRWNSERTRRLLARLGPIPHDCGLECVMGGVRVSDYEDLVVGTDDERLLRGYIAALSPMVTQILRGIPKNERIEFVFEEQRQYEPYVNMTMPFFTMPGSASLPDYFTDEGLPKLAKWGFVPKGTTILTDPSDYLAFAIHELNTNKESRKAKWCAPILRGDGCYGVLMSRAQVRRSVVRAQAMFNATGPFSPL